MAYVSDYATQFSSTGATSYVLTLPEHQSGDVLVVGANADAGVTLAMSGWTQIGVTQISAATSSSAMWYIRASSSTTTGTITMGAADAINVSMFVLTGVDATTAVDVTSSLGTSTSGVFTTASQFNSASVTTTTADCLIIYYIGIEPASTVPISALTTPTPAHFLDSSDAGGSTATTMTGSAAAWYFQRSIGATPTPLWDLSASSITHRFVVAFRNTSGGIIPPYIDDSVSLGNLITTGAWVSSTAKDGQSFPTSITHASVGPTGNTFLVTGASGNGTTATITFSERSGSIFPVGSSVTVAGITPAGYNATATVTASSKTSISYTNATSSAYTSGGTIVQTLTAAYDAGAAIVDAGFNPYSSAINSTPAANTTAALGFQVNFASTDMTTGWICGGFMSSTAKMANYNQGKIKQGGTYLVVSDTTNFSTYRVMAQDNQDGNGTGFSIIAVRPNQTYSKYGGSTTAPTITAINKLFIGHRGQNATGAFYYADIHLFKQVTAAGGTSAVPVDTQGLFNIGRYCRIPLIKKAGAYGLLAYVPIQIGGGDAINFQINAGSLQFPRIFDIDSLEINYHGALGDIGISYAGKAGDVIKHTNSVITSPSTYYWSIHAAATSAATWDFSGLVVVNSNVTLRPVVTFDSMAFSGCPTINATSCAVTNSTISTVPNTNNSLTATSATFDGCTITVTGLAAGNYLTSLATPAGFTNCVFIGSASTGHAIRITTPGTYSLSNDTWTNFGATGTTSAAIFNDSGGAVTLNVTGTTGNSPSYRNGTSATTSVVNTKTFVVNNIVDGSEVRIYKQSDLSELGGAENVGAAPSGLVNVSVAADPDNAGRYKVTYSYGYVSDIPIYVVVFHTMYQALRPAAILKATDGSLQVAQNTDRQYDIGSI